MKRETFVYGSQFWDFYNQQSQEVQEKIDYVIDLVRSVPVVPEKFLKQLEGTNGLYELRIEYAKGYYRIFCFFDEGRLVILLNGFKKTTAKTPSGEIKRAQLLKKEYYHEKGK